MPLSLPPVLLQCFKRRSASSVVDADGKCVQNTTKREQPSLGRKYEVLLYKPKQSSVLGIHFISRPQDLPRPFTSEQAVVFFLTDIALTSSIAPFDVVTKVNGFSVKSTLHAIMLIREAVGNVRITIQRCPPNIIESVRFIQTRWRKQRNIARLTIDRQGAAMLGICLNPRTPQLALVSKIKSWSILHGKLQVGDALLFVNGSLCCTPVQSTLLLRSATGYLDILYRPADTICRTSFLQACIDSGKHSQQGYTTEDECSICFSDMTHPQPWHAGCGHSFCAKCSERARSRSAACPICRATPQSFSRTLELIKRPSTVQ
eukprot:6188052-Pleurochrysis_carterae.AAC.8